MVMHMVMPGPMVPHPTLAVQDPTSMVPSSIPVVYLDSALPDHIQPSLPRPLHPIPRTSAFPLRVTSLQSTHCCLLLENGSQCPGSDFTPHATAAPPSPPSQLAVTQRGSSPSFESPVGCVGVPPTSPASQPHAPAQGYVVVSLPPSMSAYGPWISVARGSAADVADIKKGVEAQTDLRPSDQTLAHGNHLLLDDMAQLRSLGVASGDVLALSTVEHVPKTVPKRVPTPWLLHVELPPSLEGVHGPTLTIPAAGRTTVGQVKAKLALVTGLGVAEQRLAFGSSPLLLNGQPLVAAGIAAGDTLKLSTSPPHSQPHSQPPPHTQPPWPVVEVGGEAGGEGGALGGRPVGIPSKSKTCCGTVCGMTFAPQMSTSLSHPLPRQTLPRAPSLPRLAEQRGIGRCIRSEAVSGALPVEAVSGADSLATVSPDTPTSPRTDHCLSPNSGPDTSSNGGSNGGSAARQCLSPNTSSNGGSNGGSAARQCLSPNTSSNGGSNSCPNGGSAARQFFGREDDDCRQPRQAATSHPTASHRGDAQSDPDYYSDGPGRSFPSYEGGGCGEGRRSPAQRADEDAAIKLKTPSPLSNRPLPPIEAAASGDLARPIELL